MTVQQPIRLFPPRITTRSALRLLGVTALMLLLAGCFLFRREKDELDVEELRLEYQQGKMRSLLEIIEIYEDTEQPLSVRLAAANAMGESRHPKAVASLAKDEEKLLSFYDFPAAHWQTIRSTNVIESAFATVRLRQRVTKGAGIVIRFPCPGSCHCIPCPIPIWRSLHLRPRYPSRRRRRRG